MAKARAERENAILRGEDYQRYLAIRDEITEPWKQLGEWKRPRDRYYIPKEFFRLLRAYVHTCNDTERLTAAAASELGEFFRHYPSQKEAFVLRWSHLHRTSPMFVGMAGETYVFPCCGVDLLANNYQWLDNEHAFV